VRTFLTPGPRSGRRLYERRSGGSWAGIRPP
jgi:hypothetical protein